MMAFKYDEWLEDEKSNYTELPDDFAMPDLITDFESLSESQQAAIEAIDHGHNMLITGPAGSGKSYLIEYLKRHHRATVTASTGLAALNVGGTTIHKWAGIGIAEGDPEEIAEKIQNAGWSKDIKRRISDARLLIIDEISMISDKVLTCLDVVFRRIRFSDEPFGGIQMLCFGDFFQLPPVSRAGETFCFKSPTWERSGFKYCELTKVFRQADGPFSSALQRIRRGICSPADAAILRSRDGLIPEGLKPVYLFPTNAQVDEMNMREMLKIPGPTRVYHPSDVLNAKSPAQEKLFLDQLNRDCLASNPLILKEGAQVMLLKNLTPSLVNGSMGIVIEMAESSVKVQFTDQEIWIEPKEWTLQEGNTLQATRKHIPLRLAWGLSIHKSQGQSLDRVYLDLTKIFEKGQAYVGLSRCRSLEGLFLNGFHESAIQAHPDAIEFYQQQEMQNETHHA